MDSFYHLMHHTASSELVHPKNIFKQLPNKEQPRQWQNITLYSLVGDPQFKTKFISDKSKTQDLKSLNKTFNNTSFIHSSDDKLNATSTIPRETVFTNLSLDKKLRASREHRSFLRFQSQKKDWNKTDDKLMRLMHKDSTLSKDSFKDLYTHPNPQRAQLVNQNVPEYWKHSLRNNNKRLKSHVKGNKFRQQLAEEMLQTHKGTRKLEQSMPRIHEQHQKVQKPQKIVLFGTKKIRSLSERVMPPIDGSQETYDRTNPSMLNTIGTFEEVLKIHYKPEYRWMGFQNI